jgi:hypothetical protein
MKSVPYVVNGQADNSLYCFGELAVALNMNLQISKTQMATLFLYIASLFASFQEPYCISIFFRTVKG